MIPKVCQIRWALKAHAPWFLGVFMSCLSIKPINDSACSLRVNFQKNAMSSNRPYLRLRPTSASAENLGWPNEHGPLRFWPHPKSAPIELFINSHYFLKWSFNLPKYPVGPASESLRGQGETPGWPEGVNKGKGHPGALCGAEPPAYGSDTIRQIDMLRLCARRRRNGWASTRGVLIPQPLGISG